MFATHRRPSFACRRTADEEPASTQPFYARIASSSACAGTTCRCSWGGDVRGGAHARRDLETVPHTIATAFDFVYIHCSHDGKGLSSLPYPLRRWGTQVHAAHQAIRRVMKDREDARSDRREISSRTNWSKTELQKASGDALEELTDAEASSIEAIAQRRLMVSTLNDGGQGRESLLSTCGGIQRGQRIRRMEL